jgi:hypothetical protein
VGALRKYNWFHKRVPDRETFPQGLEPTLLRTWTVRLKGAPFLLRVIQRQMSRNSCPINLLPGFGNQPIPRLLRVRIHYVQREGWGGGMAWARPTYQPPLTYFDHSGKAKDSMPAPSIRSSA